MRNPTVQVAQRRLKKLANFIRKLPETDPKTGCPLLNMEEWMGRDSHGHLHKHADIKCGTPACALGWATAVWPKHLYHDIKLGIIRLTGVPLKEVSKETDESGFTSHSFVAAMKFFRLTAEQAEFLFGGYDRTPTTEADLIEDIASSIR